MVSYSALVIILFVYTLAIVATFIWFYANIISRVKEKLSKDIIKETEKRVGQIVTEFNKSALNNIDLLEEESARLKEIIALARDTKVSSQTPSVASKPKEKVKPFPSSFLEDSPILFSDEDFVDYPKEMVKKVYNKETGETKRNFSVTVGEEGVIYKTNASNINATVCSLFEGGMSVEDIALRVKRSAGEVELILSFAGKF